MKLLKKGINGFTLVELIVVIIILAVLGTIAFISLQGYTREARDSKRLSDVNNVYKKITLERVKGVYPSNVMSNGVSTSTGLIIMGLNPTESKQGKVNFEEIKESETSFKDPNGNDYVLGYAAGGSGTGAYKFIQIATISESKNEAVLVGDYYKSITTDSESIIFLDPNNTNLGIIEDKKSVLPYQVDSTTTNNVVTYACISQPNYPNAVFTAGIATTVNEAWQNINNTNPCYYECNLGFTGNDCSTSLISCKNILDLGLSTGSGIYQIDPGNTGTPFPAYCDMSTDGGGWTLMVASGMGFGKTSLFWDGTLNSNTNFTFTGNTLNTGNAEKIIKNLSFTDAMFNFNGKSIYRSSTTSTFKSKKDNLTAWTNISGNLGTMTWNRNDTDGYTNGNFLLGMSSGDAGYGDYYNYFIGGNSYAASWSSYYGNQFIEFNNIVICPSRPQWCLYSDHTSNYGIGINTHRYTHGSLTTTGSYTMFIR